jgi:hypothetical protein
MSGKAQPKARIFPPRAALIVLRIVPTGPMGWPMKLPASSPLIADRHTDHELVRRGTRTREVLPSRSLQRPPTDTLDFDWLATFGDVRPGCQLRGPLGGFRTIRDRTVVD